MEWLLLISGLVILVIVLIILRRNSRKNSELTDVIRDQNEQLKIALARAEEKIDGLILDNARLTEDAKAERNKHFELSASNERLKSFYQAREEKIKELTKATIRCIPLDNPQEEGRCILTGNPSKERVLFARAY